MAEMIDPGYPEPDPERGKRIVSDVITLMKLSNDESTRTKVARWLSFTLFKAQRLNRLPWWFARRLFACMVYEGQDVFDLQGNLDKIINLYAPKKLGMKPIGFILDHRAEHNYQFNLGEPAFYAIHGGRIHLWPAPEKETLLVITYCIPVTASIAPPEWEGCLVDGIIGFYGRHFDQSGMLENPGEFTQRFMAGIKASRTEHFDSEAFERQVHCDITHSGLTSFRAYAETNTPAPENAIIKPAYDGAPGQIQILADSELMKQNQRGTPIAQIPGD